jgi:hypothetical protein
MSTKDAVNKMRSELKRDKGFYETYHATISMAFYDEAKAMKIKIPHAKLIALSNAGATRFLKLFIDK